ncbi:MAG: hypothetical protein M3O30_13275 [Planctomycetota bacterium]|nr:hypothetical protein [Planctomycetota bacterium]
MAIRLVHGGIVHKSLCILVGVAATLSAFAGTALAGHTAVSIKGEDFYLNGSPTYKGRTWNGHRIEGLLLNFRMVNGIFDDLNPSTVHMWAYPDTRKWDPNRNTNEFVAAMSDWHAHGLLAVTVNLQGGSPQGFSHGAQTWINSAFTSKGSLEKPYFDRLTKILDRADQLGMVVILGYFYQGQDHRVSGNTAVETGVDNATNWVLSHGYTNVVIEINNECDQHYANTILQPANVAQLITRAKNISVGGHHLLVSTSYSQGLPQSNVVAVADFILVHGNGISSPSTIGSDVRQIRVMCGRNPRPIVFNEDDHYNFNLSTNDMEQAVANHGSWGYFDFRRSGESFANGFQSMPADWKIDSTRKTDFFNYLKSITGF